MASMVHHLIAVLVILGTVIDHSDGHGRLIQPVGRATMWRYGYKTPPDYNDNQLYCGGRGHQWNHNGGKCGVCGDAYDQPQPRDHEAGGKYGLGIIVERYVQSQVIDVNVELTANHRGNFEFRICDTNHPKIPATEECLNRNMLSGVDGRTKFFINAPGRDFNFKLMLPPYLKCSHCVFQWKYEAAQNPGNKQEHFINCADVAIDSRSNLPYQPPVQTNKPYIPYVPPTQKPYKPYVPPTQKPYKPYVPPTQKPIKPYVPPTQKPYKPYVPPTQKPYKPYVSPTQKPYKPYVPPTQKPYKPYVPPTQTPYKPYVPPTQTPYKPYVPPTQKPYKPYVPPTQKPYIPPPPNPGTEKPILPFYPIKVTSKPTTQSVLPPFNIIRPSSVQICPKRCFLYCQLSIRMCPDICRNCYTLP